MFRHILVPLDGSPLAENALSVATRIARATGASLILLRVYAGLDDLPLQGKGMPVNVSSVFQKERDDALAYLQNIVASLPLQDLDVHIHVVQDHPAHAILAESQLSGTGTDAIVMCSHGNTGLKRWMMGSVSRKVVRHSPVPVLLLRPQESGTALLTQKPVEQLRILVPLDGSALAEEALPPAIALCKAFPASKPGRLHLTCIVPLFALQLLEMEQDQVVENAQSYLTLVEQQLRQQEETADLTITSSVTFDRDGDVAHAIAALAETGKGMVPSTDFTGYDLIALSTHGSGGFAHWMMGSITERVLDATKLPVLIAHPKEMVEKLQAEQQKHERTHTSEQNQASHL